MALCALSKLLSLLSVAVAIVVVVVGVEVAGATSPVQQQRKQALQDPTSINLQYPYRVIDFTSGTDSSHSLLWLLRVTAAYGFYAECASPANVYGLSRQNWLAMPPSASGADDGDGDDGDGHGNSHPSDGQTGNRGDWTLVPVSEQFGATSANQCDSGKSKCHKQKCKTLVANATFRDDGGRRQLPCAHLAAVYGCVTCMDCAECRRSTPAARGSRKRQLTRQRRRRTDDSDGDGDGVDHHHGVTNRWGPPPFAVCPKCEGLLPYSPATRQHHHRLLENQGREAEAASSPPANRTSSVPVWRSMCARQVEKFSECVAENQMRASSASPSASPSLACLLYTSPSPRDRG